MHAPEPKLLVLWVSLKTSPLQVLRGELLGLSQPGGNSWIHRLWPVVREARDSWGVLPQRDPKEFAPSPGPSGIGPRLIIEGTERRRQRPKNPAKQALHSSGKKKAPTDKSVVIVNLPRQSIDFWSRTYGGKIPDQKIADREGVSYPRQAELYKDPGFQGYEPAATRTYPAKQQAAPRGTDSR